MKDVFKMGDYWISKEEFDHNTNFLKEARKKFLEPYFEKIGNPNTNLPHKVYNKMTDEEVQELFILSLSGYHDGNAILMGRDAIQRVIDFKNQMIQKYE